MEIKDEKERRAWSMFALSEHFSANFVSLANEFIITLPVDRSFARTAEGLKIRKLKQISVNAKA